MNKLLLSHKWKKLGWILFIPSGIYGTILLIFEGGIFDIKLKTKVFAIVGEQPLSHYQYFSFIDGNISMTLLAMVFIIGALLICFSKERQEDEFVTNLRLSSLLWSVLINYILLLLFFLFVWGPIFYYFLVYMLFSILIIFILRFHYVLYRDFKTNYND